MAFRLGRTFAWGPSKKSLYNLPVATRMQRGPKAKNPDHESIHVHGCLSQDDFGRKLEFHVPRRSLQLDLLYLW